MDDYLEKVKLLCKYNIKLGNINKEKIQLIVTLSYSYGAIATYLRTIGVSIFTRNNKGILILDIAKLTLKELEEIKRILSRMENNTRARYLDGKTNKENFTKIIDLVMPA
jgi:hypothetical protein